MQVRELGGGWGRGRRGMQPRGTQGWSGPLFQFKVKRKQPTLTPKLSNHGRLHILIFIFGKNSSKLHLPTNAPSSDVRAQSTSSSVRILLPAWNFWRIRGKFPPTLLFQDKVSSSRSGIALSAAPVTEGPEDWSLVCKAENALQNRCL